MTNRLCLTLCLSMLPAVAFAAAPKEHAVESPALPAAAAPAGEAALSQPAEVLPDLPETHLPALTFRAQPSSRPLPADRTSRIRFGSPRSRGVSVLASMPLAGTARHLGAQRFNTDDGSMLDDFAICYRISSRSSIEVIPGDPAPVKLPLVSMANSTGVTVGLVVRLSR